MATRIVVSVISDLVTDQRVHKVCQTLHDAGYSVRLIGSKKRASLGLSSRDYPAKRIPLIFQKKFPFYAEFNMRLFFILLFSKTDIYLGNDLDVMPSTWLASWLRGKALVYDTHEYYMAMAGLDGKPLIRKIWKGIESFIFPRVKYIYTICDSFCMLYKRDYGKELRSVRNLPYLHFKESTTQDERVAKIRNRIPASRHILLFQGAGINQHRGAEELVMAMKWLDPKKFHLLIIGGGDIFIQIERIIREESLSDRITIEPKLPFESLRKVTRLADLGLSLDKPDNLNHRYGLPNKIFDYLHAGVPVLVSRLIELEKIVVQYEVGSFIENHDPSHIATCIERIFENPEQMQVWKSNTERVKRDLNWENEGRIVLDIFEQVESERVK